MFVTREVRASHLCAHTRANARLTSDLVGRPPCARRRPSGPARDDTPAVASAAYLIASAPRLPAGAVLFSPQEDAYAKGLVSTGSHRTRYARVDGAGAGRDSGGHAGREAVAHGASAGFHS